MGFSIFLHSVRLVFTQLSGALRISAALYIISAVISGFAYLSVFGAVTNPEEIPPNIWQFYAATLVSVLIYLWIAVGWHRFVLLDEESAAPLPPFHGDRLLAYLGRLLQLCLIGLVVGLVLGLFLGLLAYLSQGNVVFLTIVPVILLTILLLLSYRVAPIFPGAAIGRPVNIGGAWRATTGATGAIFVLAVASAIASVVIDLPAHLLGLLPMGGIVSLVWLVITGWIKMMVGISIVTTIYGVYVEKRTIA